MACREAPEELAVRALQEQAETEGWREIVEGFVAGAPPDSVVHPVDVMYTSAPTAADHEILDEIGAEITYEYRLIAGFTISVPVSGLKVLLESERVAAITVPNRAITFAPAC